MNYYFVFQNAMYNIESVGGYVWAPTKQQGQHIHFHERVGQLEIGDLIIHCAQRKIRAISKVIAAPVITTSEYAELVEILWDREGYYVSLEYLTLDRPVDVGLII